jgi:tripartite-type tricarboxylate transporter receptor subunit TctC
MKNKKKLMMMMGVLVSVITLIFCSLNPLTGHTQDFPAKPVTLVLPYGAGGSHDLVARILSSVAMDYLGQPIIIQAKPGAGGVIASDFVANSPPDGYTLLFGATQPNSTIPAVEGRSKGPDDLLAVCRINYSPFAVGVQFDAPYKNLKELIEWCKANPGKMKYGNLGPWSAGDIFWKEMNKDFGITVRNIPYPGGAPAMMALLGGHVDSIVSLSSVFLPYMVEKKMRVLVALDDKRINVLPEVPTAKELGIQSVHIMWRGILAPQKTPRPIIDKLATAFMKMCQDKTVITMIDKLGDTVEYLGPDEFTRVWKGEYEHHKEMGKMFKK